MGQTRVQPLDSPTSPSHSSLMSHLFLSSLNMNDAAAVLVMIMTVVVMK